MQYHYWPKGGGITTAATKSVECSQIHTVHVHKPQGFSSGLCSVYLIKVQTSQASKLSSLLALGDHPVADWDQIMGSVALKKNKDVLWSCDIKLLRRNALNMPSTLSLLTNLKASIW